MNDKLIKMEEKERRYFIKFCQVFKKDIIQIKELTKIEEGKSYDAAIISGCTSSSSSSSSLGECGVEMLVEIKIRDCSISTYKDSMLELKKINFVKEIQNKLLYYKNKIVPFYFFCFYNDAVAIFNTENISYQKTIKCPVKTFKNNNKTEEKLCAFYSFKNAEIIKYK